ncbi:MAG: aspartate aminotransferase family protein [Candidatus Marinimicrobia bacterium]|nr:aspartate aminotransferase family protein [Candidatus Neomarinimicrobiota bacterium]
MNTAEIRKKHKEFLFPAIKNFYKEPIVVREGKGYQLTDTDGNQYLDFFGGILTVSIGHANKEINDAVIEQINRLSHVSTLYQVESAVQLAETLARITPGLLKKSFFTASGTEADETAVMMAQVFTGNTEFIALRYAYAGRSLLAQALTAHSTWRALPTQVASIKHALAPYCYRCPLKSTYPQCGVGCAEDVEELIKTTTTGEIAGMMVEPIQGVGGFITPPKEYFKVVADIVHHYGGIFISDEVQTGFGRTGKMFGIEHFDVEPDMITMAKGIANGLPLGAVITTGEIADSLVKNSISTFGGNPVSCAAANKTIEIIERDKLADNCNVCGKVLRNGLERLQQKYPKFIGDVRGMGLMQALELVVDEPQKDHTPNPKAVDQLMEETKNRGLLIGRGGLSGNVVRISPPMTVDTTTVEEAVNILDDAFAALNQ